MLSLANVIRRQLMPALERSQGFAGTYVRGDIQRPLTMIPTKPEWVAEAEKAAGVLMWKGLVFEVSVATWSATGLGVPEQGDTYTVVLGNGMPQTYSLLPPKGKRPYEMDDTGETYFLNMKAVAG